MTQSPKRSFLAGQAKRFSRENLGVHLGTLLNLGRCRRHFREYPPVFIVGAPRSGTTLLFKLLASQPFVSCQHEPGGPWFLAFGSSDDDTFADRITRWRLCQLRHLYYSLIEPGRPYLLSKDPRCSLRIPVLRRVFPSARYVHIVRDGRDVVASIVKASQIGRYIDENGWPHVRIPGFRNMLKDPSHINAARQWQYCVTQTVADLKAVPPANHTMIRYEDLLEQPYHQTLRLLQFSYARYDEASLQEVVSGVSNFVGTSSPENCLPRPAARRSPTYGTAPSSVLFDAGSGTMSTSQRIGKWRTELPEELTIEACRIMQKTLEQFDYGN